MNAKARVALWAAFWLFSFLTWLIDVSLWMMDWRSTLRFTFAIISFILAVGLLVNKERSRRSIALVVVGLVVGQWWLIQLVAVYIIWTIRGFAP